MPEISEIIVPKVEDAEGTHAELPDGDGGDLDLSAVQMLALRYEECEIRSLLNLNEKHKKYQPIESDLVTLIRKKQSEDFRLPQLLRGPNGEWRYSEEREYVRVKVGSLYYELLQHGNGTCGIRIYDLDDLGQDAERLPKPMLEIDADTMPSDAFKKIIPIDSVSYGTLKGGKSQQVLEESVKVYSEKVYSDLRAVLMEKSKGNDVSSQKLANALVAFENIVKKIKEIEDISVVSAKVRLQNFQHEIVDLHEKKSGGLGQFFRSRKQSRELGQSFQNTLRQLPEGKFVEILKGTLNANTERGFRIIAGKLIQTGLKLNEGDIIKQIKSLRKKIVANYDFKSGDELNEFLTKSDMVIEEQRLADQKLERDNLLKNSRSEKQLAQRIIEMEFPRAFPGEFEFELKEKDLDVLKTFYKNLIKEKDEPTIAVQSLDLANTSSDNIKTAKAIRNTLIETLGIKCGDDLDTMFNDAKINEAARAESPIEARDVLDELKILGSGTRSASEAPVNGQGGHAAQPSYTTTAGKMQVLYDLAKNKAIEEAKAKAQSNPTNDNGSENNLGNK